MEIKELHEVLAELETNLRNLEAARHQVIKISNSSEIVNNSTKELIEKIEGFSNLVNKKNFEFADDFSNSLESYQIKIRDFINNSQQRTDEEIKNIRKLTSAFIDAINVHFEDFDEKTNNSLEKLDKKLQNINNGFKETTNKQISDINNLIEPIKNLIAEQKNQFEELKKDFILEHKKENQKTIKLLYVVIGILSIISILIIYQILK